jgi:hypothetical protein
MAVQWIHDFIKLSRRQMLPFTSGILVKTKDLQQHTILGGYGILIVVISMLAIVSFRKKISSGVGVKGQAIRY